jgi:hypothetical protein
VAPWDFRAKKATTMKPGDTDSVDSYSRRSISVEVMVAAVVGTVIAAGGRG